MAEPSNVEFAQRLTQACDQHPQCPGHGDGRQAWVAAQLDISGEAVRKWFAGKSRPRPATMERLAEVLGADAAWLALGITPIHDGRGKRDLARAASGAVYLVAGLIDLEGGHVAFPDTSDARGDLVHLYAIIDQRQHALHVAAAERIAPAHYRIAVPPNHAEAEVIGVVPGRHLMPRLIYLPTPALASRGQSRGGYVEIDIVTDGDAFVTDDVTWPVVTTFRQPLPRPAVDPLPT